MEQRWLKPIIKIVSFQSLPHHSQECHMLGQVIQVLSNSSNSWALTTWLGSLSSTSLELCFPERTGHLTIIVQASLIYFLTTQWPNKTKPEQTNKNPPKQQTILLPKTKQNKNTTNQNKSPQNQKTVTVCLLRLYSKLFRLGPHKLGPHSGVASCPWMWLLHSTAGGG